MCCYRDRCGGCFRTSLDKSLNTCHTTRLLAPTHLYLIWQLCLPLRFAGTWWYGNRASPKTCHSRSSQPGRRTTIGGTVVSPCPPRRYSMSTIQHTDGSTAVAAGGHMLSIPFSFGTEASQPANLPPPPPPPPIRALTSRPWCCADMPTFRPSRGLTHRLQQCVLHSDVHLPYRDISYEFMLFYSKWLQATADDQQAAACPLKPDGHLTALTSP